MSASLAISCSTFAPRIGPVGAESPSALRSLFRSGRSQTNIFFLTVQARLPPYVDPSSASGSASASRLTSSQVATGLGGGRHPDQSARMQELGELDRVRRSALAQVVADDPHVQATLMGRVTPDPAYQH